MEEIAKTGESEIAVPQISIEDILALEQGTKYLNDIFPSIKGFQDYCIHLQNRITELKNVMPKNILKKLTK